MITQNVYYRTRLIRVGGLIGSAFIYDRNDKQYIITADHILKEFEKHIEIYIHEEWISVDVNVVSRGNSELDIAVLTTGQLLASGPCPEFSETEVTVTQDAYFLGFPYGLYASDNARIVPLPFVKKAIISAIITESGNRIWYLDGHNNPGFSGGPVVFRPGGSVSISAPLKLGAIISGFRKENHPVLYERSLETGYSIEYNTGIIKSICAYHAIEMIDANPIGFPLNKII